MEQTENGHDKRSSTSNHLYACWQTDRASKLIHQISWRKLLGTREKRIQPAARRSHPPHKNQPIGVFREIYTLLIKNDIFVEKDCATVLYASASEVWGSIWLDSHNPTLPFLTDYHLFSVWTVILSGWWLIVLSLRCRLLK